MNYLITASITIFLWSTAATVFSLLLKSLQPLQIIFYNFLFSTIFFNLLLALRKKHNVLLSLKRKEVVQLILLGGLGIFLYYYFYVFALDNSPVVEANILNYLWPIFIFIFSAIILKEKLAIRMIVAIIITLIGAFFVISGGQKISFEAQYSTGYLAAVSAAVCYGLFSVLLKKVKQDAITSMTIFYSTGFLLVATMALFNKISLSINAHQLLGLLYMGIFSGGLGFALWQHSISKGETQKIAALVYFIPFLSTLWLVWVLDAQLTKWALLGLIFIIFGNLISLMKLGRMPAKTA